MARHIDQSRTHRRGEGQDEVGQAEWCMSRLADQMHRAAQILRKNKDLCASVMSVELGGKSIADSETEIEKCAWASDLFAYLWRAGSIKRSFAEQ
jgi:acyl-CoA reductase-like NAD-dependent aldehyde dehydrogenase